MRKKYNDFFTILSKREKKEQDKKLNIRIRNAKSIINDNCPTTFNVFRKRVNKSQTNDDLGKKEYNNIFYNKC